MHDANVTSESNKGKKVWLLRTNHELLKAQSACSIGMVAYLEPEEKASGPVSLLVMSFNILPIHLYSCCTSPNVSVKIA